MALTRDFKATLMADMRRHRTFRVAYLGQAIECLHGGEFSVGKRMLRNYINGTLGFAALSKATSTPAKSLMRMLSENSNPHADKLFAILGHLQEIERVKVKVLPASRARSRRKTERVSASAA
jgi:DNA-binding phage protein